ncbi:MAG: hypothetical protein DYG85_13370 [Chloroflexi bacterium CFX1]|nr:hypothetical protein [Anaerolineales bacterium]MCE7920482.1 hypothetical protein [Chloroflexi bacterium CFX1]MCK6569404.1 hypothetical protein [Anaerolineales bacterium]
MVTVRFQTKIKDGVIQIPKKYRRGLKDNVRVSIRIEDGRRREENYLDYLMANPVKVGNFQRLTREQIYVR